MASDLNQVQEFLYHGMKSCALFNGFNIVLEREFLADASVQMDALWLSARSQLPNGTPGPAGLGFLIEMPRLELPHPNSLQRNLVASIVTIEERNINQTPSVGTRVSAEEAAEMALDFMYGWIMGLSSGLTPEQGGVKPAPDVIKGDGLVVYRAAVSLRRERRPLQRCDVPTITEGPAGTFTLANGSNTPAAAIYYTLAATSGDLRLPGKDNPDAVLYAAPVALASGTLINYAAWQDDILPSHISVKQIS